MLGSEPIPRPLRPEDLADALALCEAAGWNQTESDWRLLLELAPEGCFALEVGGRVIATSTAVAWAPGVPPSAEAARPPDPIQPPFGWVGMVLVHPEHRGRGHGTRMLDRAADLLEERGFLPALDATPLGRPLYARKGFADLCAVERRVGTAAAPRAPSAAGGSFPRIDRLRAGEAEDLRTLDGESFGADRLRLIEGLLRRPGSLGLVCRSARGVEGYLIAREGRLFRHVGPWVARTAEAASALWRAAMERLAGSTVGVDVFASNEEARRLAEESGLPVVRSLVRMVRRGRGRPPEDLPRETDGAPSWQGVPSPETPPGGRADRIRALAGFEWG